MPRLTYRCRSLAKLPGARMRSRGGGTCLPRTVSAIQRYSELRFE